MPCTRKTRRWRRLMPLWYISVCWLANWSHRIQLTISANILLRCFIMLSTCCASMESHQHSVHTLCLVPVCLATAMDWENKRNFIMSRSGHILIVDGKSRSGRILIVDDEEEWRKKLVEALQQNNYIADAVDNVPLALERLSTAIHHIVVLDIRLLSQEEGGIDLLQELDRRGLKEVTKVIMLSGYGTLERMRRAFKEHEVADFLSKDEFSPQILLESVQQVFTQRVKINLDLKIEWQHVRRREDILLNLKLNGKRIGPTSPLRKQLVDDLDDLLCRLFYKAEMILVRPLTPGWSGEKVLLIQPLFGEGRGKNVIVKFGDIQRITRERNNFHKYVEPFLIGARNTTILDQRSTWHLSGTVYSLLGTGSDQLVNFPHFYQNTDDIRKIREVLSHLFRETCGNWYDNRSQPQPIDLAADYKQFFHYAPRQLEQIITRLPIVFEREQLTSPSLQPLRKFTNPLPIATKLSLTCFTSTCIVHGDFNPYNLFVDQTGFTCLIDFQSTGHGHILREFAMLYSSIRLQ